MKTEDFERLKKLCDENGFELVTESPKDNDKFFVVKKKDKWGGVEFVEVLSADIRQISEIEVDHNGRKRIWNTTGRWAFDYECKPSTEQAYIEQLKKEAFERFGEIKDGDWFDCSSIGYRSKCSISLKARPVWSYDKKRDELELNGFSFYKQGKWAERVKERISIRWEGCDGNYIKFSYYGSINLIPRMNELSALLEKYLNNEIE